MFELNPFVLLYWLRTFIAVDLANVFMKRYADTLTIIQRIHKKLLKIRLDLNFEKKNKNFF